MSFCLKQSKSVLSKLMSVSIFQMIKSVLLSLCFLSVICVVNGQNVSAKASIKGTVVDSIRNTPLGFVTMTLLEKKNNKPVRNTLTKENGSFEFIGLPSKTYLLRIESIGYKTKTISLHSFPKTGIPTIDVGLIRLTTELSGMGEVIVTTTAKKPVVKQEVDRISYDVQADPDNNSNNVLDMLRKVPLLSVDASDNIMLKGSGNYKILINGQPSALIAQNPSDLFKVMPASNIQRIEVITTPPAKYDAEGLAGIINIITKKKIGDGYNCNLSSSYNTVNGYGLNVNGTVKQRQFGLSGFIGVQVPNKQTLNNGYNNNITSPAVTYLSQQGTTTSKSHNPYGSIDFSYEIDSLNLLSANVNGYEWIYNRENTMSSTLLDSTNALQQFYGLTTDNTGGYKGVDFTLNYQRGFKNQKERLFTASYRYNLQEVNNLIKGAFAQEFNDSLPNYAQDNNSEVREQTIQLDYVHPTKNVTIEVGTKAILRNSYSDFYYNNYDFLANIYVNVPSETNNFSYQQDVLSAYNSYEVKLDKFVAKAGVRLEHTSVNADFTSVDSSIKENYNNIIPSISLQQKFNGNNSINFGFTERLQRPNIWQLNPFVNKSNPEVISFGNPKLQPVLNHSFEMNYSNFSKGNISVGISYSFANNTIQNVTSINADMITQTTYENVGKNNTLGLSLSTNYPITRQMSININSLLQQVWLKGTYNGVFYSQRGLQGHFLIGANYNFPKDYHAGITVGYNSRNVLLQGRDMEYFFMSFGGTKDLFHKKASISIFVRDPYEQYLKQDAFTSSAGFKQYNYNYQYDRRFYIAFRYKFGKLNSEIKKSEKSINNDDTNAGKEH